MKISAALFLLVIVVISEVAAGDDIPTWEEFKATYHKHYGGTRKNDEKRRHRIYNQNVAKIRAHNKLYEEGKTTYKQGVNAFSDKTAKEIIETSTGLKVPTDLTQESPTKVHQLKNNYPNVDWTNHACMSPVRNQDGCGSCWAFAANTALNTRYCLENGLNNAEEYSDQHLVDCNRNMPSNCKSNGCNGGWPVCAYYYIYSHDTSMNEYYPYTSKDGTCKDGVSLSHVIDGRTVVADFHATYYSTTESGILQALQSGPVVVAVDATPFNSYASGVLDTNYFSAFNHAVVVTGATDDHWIVQNSWGTGWGEGGYIKIKRSGDGIGVVGINYYVMWATPAKAP